MVKFNEKEDKHAATYPNPFKDNMFISKIDAAFLIEMRIKNVSKGITSNLKMSLYEVWLTEKRWKEKPLS